MADDFTSHVMTKEQLDSTWPAGKQQARYQESSTFPPLVNIAFNFGPYAPFSYRWNLEEREGNWVPISKQEPSWMERISTMKGLLGGDASATKLLEDSYPEKEAEQLSKEVSNAFSGIFGGKNPASNIFDAALSAPGEIASEGLLQDPDIIERLMAQPEFVDTYWDHLDGSINYSAAKKEYPQFFKNEYLDKSPMTESGRHSLKMLLTALKTLPEFEGEKGEVLDGILGAEETIDEGSKLMSRNLKEHWKKTGGTEEEVQGAIDATAQGEQDELNSFLDDAKAYIDSMAEQLANMPEGRGGKSTLNVPLEDSMKQYWETFLDPGGPIASYAVGGVDQKPAKPTRGVPGIKQLGEIRQFLKRAIQTAAMTAAGQGSSITDVRSGKWMYHIPAPMGYAAIFIVSVDLAGGIGKMGDKHIIPEGMRFEVKGYAVKAELQGEMAGSVDAIIFQAGIQTGAWTADFLTTFLAKRSNYLGTFALLNALNGDGVWNKYSEDVLNAICESFVSQPILDITGIGTPKNKLTTAVLAEIIKDNLRKFAKSGATNTMIKTAIEKTFLDSNKLTNTWKEAFMDRASNRSNILSTRFIYSRDAGIWFKGKTAMDDFKGKGFAAAPVLGFSQASIDNQGKFRSAVQVLSDNWGPALKKHAKGMFAEGDIAFTERLGREQL